MRLGTSALIGLVIATALSGCLGDRETTTVTPTAGGSSLALDRVDMVDNRYLPETLEVDRGTIVTWKNLDAVGHTVTPVNPAAWGTTGSGDEPASWLPQDATWSFTFEKAGTFAYYCKPHAWQEGGQWKGMIGSVTVT